MLCFFSPCFSIFVCFVGPNLQNTWHFCSAVLCLSLAVSKKTSKPKTHAVFDPLSEVSRFRVIFRVRFRVELFSDGDQKVRWTFCTGEENYRPAVSGFLCSTDRNFLLHLNKPTEQEHLKHRGVKLFLTPLTNHLYLVFLLRIIESCIPQSSSAGDEDDQDAALLHQNLGFHSSVPEVITPSTSFPAHILPQIKHQAWSLTTSQSDTWRQR